VGRADAHTVRRFHRARVASYPVVVEHGRSDLSRRQWSVPFIVLCEALRPFFRWRLAASPLSGKARRLFSRVPAHEPSGRCSVGEGSRSGVEFHSSFVSRRLPGVHHRCSAETITRPMTAAMATASQTACPPTTEKMSHPATPPTIPPGRRFRQARSRSFQSPTHRC